MAVGEGRTYSAPHGIRRFSAQVNINFARKQKKVKTDKKLSDLEAFSKLGDRKGKTESTQALFADYERLQCSRFTVRSAVERPPRIRTRSSHTSVLDSRLSKKKSENLDYTYVFVEETELEKSTRERFMREIKQQKWVENEKKGQRESLISQRHMAHDDGKNFGSKSFVNFTPRPQYCNRLVHTDKDEFSKQFCDVLGSNLCADCTRTQMQQFVIDEHTRNFPDICVSPYVLCVPQETERDVKTPFTVYRECDPLQRRRPSTVLPTPSITGLKTRPNSQCSDEKARLYASTYGDRFPRDGSRLETPVQLEMPFGSSHSSSRRSSISRYLMESKNKASREIGAGSDEDAKRSLSSSSRGVKISTLPQSPKPENKQHKKYSSDRLDPNCFSKRKTGSRFTKSSLRSKTPTISRTGKLSELSYWKFLIPEPPMMEVGRMNVSIYTPKQLPGIKIFDEALFDI